MIIQRHTQLLACASALLCAGAAHATHPDYEGERGLELQLSGGFGGATTHDESVFLPDAELPRPEVRPPTDSFGASGGVQLQVGWRFRPYLSAGVAVSYQSLAPTNIYAASEAAFEPYESTYALTVGTYARLYPMAFFNNSRTNPRVFFDTWTDRRRMEPWISVGLAYAHISRHRGYDGVGVSDSYTNWTTRYLAVPVAVGFDYRILAPLAVGIQLGLTPTFGAGTDKERYLHVVRPGSDTTTSDSSSYAPGATSNTLWYLGLGARYTFTFL